MTFKERFEYGKECTWHVNIQPHVISFAVFLLFIMTANLFAAPNPPTGVKARAGDGQALITWTAPTATEGLLVTSYTVTSNPVGLTATSSTGSPVTTSCKITGLTNNTAYTFTVTATTSAGTSVASAPSNTVKPLPGVENVNLIGTYGSVKWNAGYARALTSGVAEAFPTDIFNYDKYAGYEDVVFTADQVNTNADATRANYTSTWLFSQILLDPPAPSGPGRNSQTNFYKYESDAGITFSSDNAARSGIAVIDLGAVRNFTTLRVFQMFSDGKVTDVEMSISSTTGNTWPSYDDGTWTTVVPRSPVGPGYGSRTDNACVTCPSVYDFGATSGRYLKFQFWNAGQFGDVGYIEVQGVKLFFENDVISSADGCPPEPPTGVSATPGNTTAAVSWTAPSGSVVTSYQLQYSSNNGSSWSAATTNPATVPGSASSAQVTGLANGSSYIFRVLATNATGSSPYSSASAPVTPLVTLPDPPANPTATAGNGSAVVSWTASPGATSYTVTGSPFGSATIAAPATSCTVPNLTNGLSYTFTVTATNNNGTSGPSAATAPVLLAGAATVTTSAVSSITATTATGNGTITDLGYPNPTAYGVCWNTTGTPTIADSKVDNGAASSTGAFTASMTGLSPNTTYYVRAYATNSAGTVYGSEVSFTTTLAAEPSTQAHSIVLAGADTSSMNFSWSRGDGASAAVFVKAASAGTASPVDGTPYTANSTFTSGNQIGATGWYCVYNGTGTAVTVTGLTPGTNYQVMVCEYNGTGASTNYNAASATNNPVTLSTSSKPGAQILVNYQFEDNLNDASGHGFDGVASGTVVYDSTGHSGHALSLNGNGFVMLPDSLILKNPKFTISMWFKTTGYGGLIGYQNYVAPTPLPTEYVPILSVRMDGKLYAEMWTGTSMAVTSASAVNDGVWHRVVMSVGLGTIRVYLDGVDIGGQSGTVQHLSMKFNQIGTNDGNGRTQLPATGWNPFSGLIDEFTFYSDSQSAAEVAKTTQTISFSSITDKTISDAPFSITATASSGLPVTFTSGTPSVCTVSGNTVTIVGPGTAIIYANQSGDATYSEAGQVSQSFVVISVPTVTTQAVSSIGATIATGNGTITALGVPNPTAYGVCWNTTGTPTIADFKVDKGAANATGAFTASMTNLSPNTTYYVRAFATNNVGTSYGGEVSFTTQNAMVLQFNTNLEPGNKSVTLPLYGTVNVTVEWGDGSSDTYNSVGLVTHTYGSEGTYQVCIYGNLTNFGNLTGYANASKLVRVTSFGGLGLTSLSGAFTGAINLTEVPASLPATVTELTSAFKQTGKATITGLDGWNVSNVTTMSNMFNGNPVFDMDLSSWNTCKVTNMSGMFGACSNFNQNIGSWDVSKVTDMSMMFYADTLFNQDIGGWNVGSLTNMFYMFMQATGFNQDISNWNVGNVTSMNGTFCGATAFDQPIGSWNVGNVTDMSTMFREAKAFNQDIGGWDVSKVTNMSQMLMMMDTFNQDISNWNVGNVTNMMGLFWMNYNFNQNISSWNVSKAENMSFMFYNDTSFNQPIGNWDVSSCTNMSGMFSSALSFDQDVGDWDISNVTNMNSMFQEAKLSVTNYDSLLAGWSQRSVQSGINFNGGSSKYSSTTGAAARALLTGVPNNWTITDGGAALPPTVTTTTVSAISDTTASSGGNVTDEGSAAVTARGVVWDTSSSPTVTTNIGSTSDGTGTGVFPSSLTGLTAGTTYYIRAYATNSFGTSYGDEISFSSNKSTQTITFNALDSKTYGDADFDPGATASSTLQVSYTSDSLSVATIVNGKVHIVRSGVTTIRANQTGDSHFNAASEITRQLTVSKKTLTVNGFFTIWPKTYDASSAADIAIDSLHLIGIVSGDTVGLHPVAAFADRFADTAKTVSLTAASSLTGVDSSKYVLSLIGAPTAKGTITRMPLQISGMTAANKTYDGTNTATLSGGTLVGIQGTDTVSIQSRTGIFMDSAIGDNKWVAVTGIVLAGPQAVNYTYIAPIGIKASILAPELNTIPQVSSTVTDGSSDVTSDPVFGWSSITHAAKYHIQVATGSFDSPLIDTMVTDTTVLLHLANSTTYQWRISSVNTAGAGPWDTLSFTTAAAAPAEPPVIASTESVPDNAADVSSSPTLSWPAVDGATGYLVQLSTNSDFGTLVKDTVITGDSLSLANLADGTQYFWRIAAKNGNGTSGWDTLSFTTAAVMPAEPPVISTTESVPDNAADVSSSPTLSWSAVDGATGYLVQLSTNSDFGTLVKDTVITGDSLSLANLADGTQYFWRIAAKNGNGTSGWDTLSFTTAAPAPENPPVLPPTVSVPDSATDVSVTPVLTWPTVTGATGYRIQLSSSAEFTDSLIIDTLIGGDSLSLENLQFNQKYYWRIASQNGNGVSGWDTLSFTTVVPPPTEAPVVTTVIPSNVPVGTTVNLSWDTIPGATGYHVQLAQDSLFASVVRDTILQVHTIQAGSLDDSTSYYWRVAARNAAGDGSWSNAQQFVTMAQDTTAKSVTTTVVTDSVANVNELLQVNTGTSSNTTGMIVTVKEKTFTGPAAIAPVTNVLDFTGSSRTSFDSVITLTVKLPSTAAEDSVPLSVDQQKQARPFWIDSTGTLMAIYDAKYDSSNGVWNIPTYALGTLVMAIDTVAPLIQDSTSKDTKVAGTELALAGKVTDLIGNVQTFAYFRKGGDDTWDSIPVTLDNQGEFSLSSTGKSLDGNGFEYFLAAYNGSSRTVLPRENIPVKVNNLTDTTVFPSMQWHLLAAPLTLSHDSMTALLPQMGTYGHDWKLFERVPTAKADSFVEFVDGAGQMKTGTSYWLKTNRKDLCLLIDSGTTVPVNKCFTIEIPSKSWAAIANPYLFAVSWQNILDSSCLTNEHIVGPYTYRDSSWVPPSQVDKMEPWEGYYVRNNADTAITIRIPSIRYKAPLVKQAGSPVMALEWEVRGSAARDYRNYFGFAKGSTDGCDPQFDFPKPVSPESGVRTYFARSSLARTAQAFQTDFVSPDQGGGVWDVKIEGMRTGEPYYCHVHNLQALPDSIQVWAVDHSTGIKWNLRESDFGVGAPEGKTDITLQVVIGTADYVAKATGFTKTVPTKFAVSSAFPNPVRSSMQIRYTVPYDINNLRMPVRLSVFDLNGRLVEKTTESSKSAGWYTIQWNATSGSKGRVATGSYCYKLTVGKYTHNQMIRVIR